MKSSVPPLWSRALYLAARSVALAALSFMLAVLAYRAITRAPDPQADVGERDVFAQMGLSPGRQLLIYYIGGSGCRSCGSSDISTLLKKLRSASTGPSFAQFASVRLVAAAINTDKALGLKYLAALPESVFDEIAVGGGWHSEALLQLVRAFGVELSAPQLILVSRTVNASMDPFRLTISQDSLVGILDGRDAIMRWSTTDFALDSVRQLSR